MNTYENVKNYLDEETDELFNRFQTENEITNSELPFDIEVDIETASRALAEAIRKGMDWQKEHAPRTHYYDIYAPEADITFILKRIYQGTELITEEVSGYYYGEPTPELTEEYKESNKHSINGD